MKEITTKDSCIYADFEVLCDYDLYEEFQKQTEILIEEGKYAVVAIYRTDNNRSISLPVSKIYDFLSKLPLITILVADDFNNTDPELLFAFDMRVGKGPYTIKAALGYDGFAYDFNARFVHLFGKNEYKKMIECHNGNRDYTSDLLIIDCTDSDSVFDCANKYIDSLTAGKSTFQLNSILKCYSHVKCSETADTEKMSDEELLQFVTQIVHIS
ncbi:MAG: hypothetical protein Q4F95_05475 [Oscillospiraceae bacterium]|nr:hypothetical protein [Oscillospiraceae bacterium]